MTNQASTGTQELVTSFKRRKFWMPVENLETEFDALDMSIITKELGHNEGILQEE